MTVYTKDPSREEVIARAAEIEPDTMGESTYEGPGAFEAAGDRELATALDVLYLNGAHDEQAGTVETGVHLARVGRFVLATNDQGFKGAAAYESPEMAQRDLDARDLEDDVEDA